MSTLKCLCINNWFLELIKRLFACFTVNACMLHARVKVYISTLPAPCETCHICTVSINCNSGVINQMSQCEDFATKVFVNMYYFCVKYSIPA